MREAGLRIFLLITRVGLRGVDVKRLTFADFDWSGNRLCVVHAGRAYYQRLADGNTPLEAVRCLKRHLSDVVYRQLVADAKASPGGHSGATPTSSAADPTP